MTQEQQDPAWDAPHHGQQPVDPTSAPPQGYGPPTGPTQQPGPQYGQQYGQQYGYAGVPVAQGPPAPASAVVLLVLSGVLALVASWTLVGLAYLAPTVLGIVALTRNRTDHPGARRLARTGWVVFAIVTGLLVLLAVAAVVTLLAVGVSSSSGYDGSSI